VIMTCSVGAAVVSATAPALRTFEITAPTMTRAKAVRAAEMNNTIFGFMIYLHDSI